MWATMWLLGIELRTSRGAVSALNHWAIPPALDLPFFKVSFPLSFFISFFLWICMWVHCSCLQTHQKRAWDPITDGCEPSCGCWELNSGPLEEQSVLLTTEPSLQPPAYLFLRQDTVYIKNKCWGAGDMAQWLRTLTAPPEVLSSILSNHMVAHNHL